MIIVHHVDQTQPQQTILRTPPYTPAQTPNVLSSPFAMNTVHTNPQIHPKTFSTLSRPLIHVIPNNPL